MLCVSPPPPKNALPCRPPPSDEERGLLRERLLGSSPDDLEAAPSDGDKRRRKHSWIALVGIAATYMWP